jgi:hypothetical protein
MLRSNKRQQREGWYRAMKEPAPPPPPVELPPAPLPKYFRVIDAGEDWHLRCKVCGKGWALKKHNDHPGNLLALLNHAHSHRENL